MSATQEAGQAVPEGLDATVDDQRIHAALEGVGHKWLVPRDGMTCVEIQPEDAHALLERLAAAGFETCTLVTAIDHYPAEPRFHLVWQLASIRNDDRIRIHAPLPGDDPHVASCIDIWPGAAFGERECYDMFGIRFDGHEGLRRLLMPEGYDHHPLRKDFPHQGIQPDRLYREWDRARREAWEADA